MAMPIESCMRAIAQRWRDEIVVTVKRAGLMIKKSSLK